MTVKIKKGDTVSVTYTGTYDNGEVFDSSEGRDPLEFKLGTSQVIPGFDDGVTGMNIGDKKTIKIPKDQAYGETRDELIVTVQKDQLPPGFAVEVGQQLSIPQENGGAMPVTVTEITDDNITLDANHRLAGKDLTFEIELVEI